MIKLEGNVSVVDFNINRSGSIDNLAQFIADNGLETVNQNLLGFETDPYDENNSFSNELKKRNRIVSTREEASAELTAEIAFDKGFDIGFDTE